MKKYWLLAVPAVFFTIIFLILPSYLDSSNTIQKLSLETRDIFFKIRQISSQPPEAIGKIMVVSIDEESCEKLQARWPWPRRIFAQMIEQLGRHGARVIGLNVSFAGLEDQSAESTQAMAEAIKEQGDVVIGATFDKENQLVRPNQILIQGGVRYGYLEKIVDGDLEIRRSYLIRLYEKKTNYESNENAPLTYEASFPLQIVNTYLGPRSHGLPQFNAEDHSLLFSGTAMQVRFAEDESYAINFLLAEKDIPQIPAWKVVQGRFADQEVRDKIVLVGLTSSLFYDRHATPLGVMPGVDIHANEIISILSQRPLKFVQEGLMFFLAWLLGLCLLILFMNHRFWLGLVGFLVALFGIFISVELLIAQDIILEPFVLLMGCFMGSAVGFVSDFLLVLFENKGLESKVTRDKMTNLYNYEYLRMRLDEEWKRCQKLKVPVSLVMTDLDRFKRINDTLGHEVGNQMILRAAAVIRQSVRGYDVVSRYGGDEFVILLWQSDEADAKAYRERLREYYHKMAAALDSPLLKDSSISIGIASYDPRINARIPRNPQELVENADKDLFFDKESRRKIGESSR